MSRRTPSPSSGPTLLQILQRPNPKIKDAWVGTSYGNSSGNFDQIQFDTDHPSVQPWSDFTFEAIYLAYGDLLDRTMTALEPGYRLVPGPSPRQDTTIIEQEADVDTLGLAWSVNIVRAPIVAASNHLRPQVVTQQSSEDPGPVTALCHKRVKWVKPTDAKQNVNVSFTPDWTILDFNTKIHYREDKPGQSEKYLALVIGDSKLEQKWKSQWLTLADSDLNVAMDPPMGSTLSSVNTVKIERLLPLQQVATYCRFAQTRYAFLITQTELVACRIRRLPEQQSRKLLYAAIEYVSVPWDATTRLTVNLAIWALGCMGMNDAHREMESSVPERHVALNSMVRLTWWKHDAKSQVYQNVISNRRIPEAEWKKLDTRFVHLDDESGSSFTRDFLPVSLRAPTPTPTSTSGGIGSLPQKMRNLNLGGPASSRAPARPSARPSQPPAGPSQPSVPSANKPAGRTTRNSTKAGVPPTGLPGPPGPSGAPALLPEPFCVINGKPYPAHCNRERNWEVTLNRQTFLIERDMQQRIHFVNHNGNILTVTKMPFASG